MKLRMKGNSLRFRLLKSEVQDLRFTGRVQEEVSFSRHFRADKLTYAIEHSRQFSDVEVLHSPQQILVQVPHSLVENWAAGDDVGIYSDIPLAGGDSLAVMIEKDFACLDRSDEDNRDTFENPLCKVC
jgi:hypothetical protein